MCWSKKVTERLFQIPRLLALPVRNYRNYDRNVTERIFPEREPYVRRYGYKDRLFAGGLLPRQKDAKPIEVIPKYRPKDVWTEKRALFGQNDYIDILGSGRVHPAQLLTHIPPWLRGFRGNEFQVLQKRLNAQGEYLREMKPKKYQDMKKRSWHLYRYLNLKTKSAR